MEIQEIAISIVRRLRERHFQAYFAGGWVRDFLMGHPSADIDIATDATCEEIIALFPRTIQVGIAFGVVVVVEEGHHFEVATFRKDIGYDGRSPQKIELASAEVDASRRDFTINGMFYDPLNNEIYDFVGGRADLEKGIIRTIGEPHVRFEEDRLRMVRAVRFASRFGFQIAPETDQAIQFHAKNLFPAVAMERIWQEFNKMQQYPHFDVAINEMARLGLLQVIFPNLTPQPLEKIYSSTAAYMRFPKETPTILFITSLFPEATLEDLQKLCLHLKISKQDLALAELGWRTEQLLQRNADQVELAEWARFYSHPHANLCIEVFYSKQHEISAEEYLKKHFHRRHLLSEDIKRIQAKTPLVTSEELLLKGIAPGKQMGSLLKEAERIAINQRLHHCEDVIRELMRSQLWSL